MTGALGQRGTTEVKEFLTSLIGSMPIGVLALDIEGRCTLANRRAAEAFETEPERLIDTDLDRLLCEWPALRARMPPIRRDGRVAFDLVEVARGRRVYNVSGRVIVNGTLVTLFDVTDEVRIREKQSRLVEQLSVKNQDLENFARVVSHDLKTPIRGIADLADFLEEDLEDYLASGDADPGVRRNLERLREQASRGQTLISGILNYSIVGMENEPLAAVDTRRLLERIGESLSLRPGQLIVEGDWPILDTCAVRFEQVLTNLMSNAVKYNPDERVAVVRVTAERLSDFYRFSVTDNGVGIEPRFHERVFDAFTTIEQRADIDSSGVGLSIVKKAVELVGGAIVLESELGAGSTFRFTWPAQPDGPAARDAA